MHNQGCQTTKLKSEIPTKQVKTSGLIFGIKCIVTSNQILIDIIAAAIFRTKKNVPSRLSLLKLAKTNHSV